MKVAVTGASGFIGRHLLRELVKRKAEIIAVTRDATHLTGAEYGVDVVEADIGLASEDWFDLLGRPDVLIHLAWGGLPNYHSLHHFETELPLHYGFLKAMVKTGLSALVVTGTCFEYGMQSGPLSENQPTQPDNPYGYAKDCLRRQLQFLQAAQPFDLTWARLFYLYGEGQALTALYPQLKQAVMKGDRSFNMSRGEQLRDYLPVTTAAASIAALASGSSNTGVVNICSGKPVSVRSLVEGWLRHYNWKIDLNLGHYSYPEYEPMAFWGDRSRLDAILGSSL